MTAGIWQGEDVAGPEVPGIGTGKFWNICIWRQLFLTVPGPVIVPEPWQRAKEERGETEEYWFERKVLYQCTEERKAIGWGGLALECAKKEKFFYRRLA